MKNIKLLILIVVIIIGSANLAYTGISIQPDRHIITMQPGQEEVVGYSIYNAGQEDIDVKFEPENWTGVKPYNTLPIGSWLFLEDNILSIKPGETKSFTVKVKALDGMEGELLAMIFAAYKENIDSMINIRRGNPLYLVIEGTQEYGAEIESVNAVYRKGILTKDDYVNISINVSNTGNIHIIPDIRISVKDDKGVLVKHAALDVSKIILRGQRHTFPVNWETPEELYEGRYSLTVNLGYEDKIKNVEKSISFEFKNGKLTVLDGKTG
jgi:hypothetical protein